jgi:hypothetical protein
MLRRLALVSLAALAAAACRIPVDELDPLASAEGFCQTFFGDLLTTVERCERWTEGVVEREWAGIVEGCGVVAAGEDAGRLRYDREAGEGCVEALRAASCASAAGVLAACGDALEGRVEVGGSCFDTLECAAPDATCAHPYATCPGTCLRPGVEGEGCGEGRPACAAGHFCASGTCAPHVPVGSGCYDHVECGPTAFCGALYLCERAGREGDGCGPLAYCADGLYCVNFICRAPQGVGAPCTDDSHCDARVAYCDAAYASPTPGCAPKRLDGAPCLGDEECASPSVCRGALAAAPSAPQSSCAPRASLGQPCVLGADDCVEGTRCDATGYGQAGRCVANPVVTQRCDSAPGERVRCTDAWCGVDPQDTSVRRCFPYLRAGGECTDDEQCGAESFGGARPRCARTSPTDSVRVCVAACTPG